MNKQVLSKIIQSAKTQGIDVSDPEALLAFSFGFADASSQDTKVEEKNEKEEKKEKVHYSLRTGAPPLDPRMFEDLKMVEKVKESQRRRFPIDPVEHIEAKTQEDKVQAQKEMKEQQLRAVKLVDDAAKYQLAYKKSRHAYDQMKAKVNELNKNVGKLMKAKKRDEAKQIMEEAKELKKSLPAMEKEYERLIGLRDQQLNQIGNVIPSDRGMVFTHNEDLSPTPKGMHYGVGMEGTADLRRNTDAKPEKVLNHIDLMHRLGIRDIKEGGGDMAGAPAEGARIAGARGYFLKSHAVSLNQALINYGLAFLQKRKYIQLQTPFFMNKESMALCAQLDDFDEQLYKVLDGSDAEKYLIATSEQPLCAFHASKRINAKTLPHKYAGYSTCFRKESGSHGRDTLGIFRVKQFEKVEQFCVTDHESSWKMMDEMIRTSRDFYESLEIPYKVINIVSGELNNAAAQKYDLEAWFPAAKTYRELVSCSNCTDYQARRVQCRVAGKRSGEEGEFVHMLNSTLTATERTLCCLLENHQTEDGVNVPKVLVPYMPENSTFIPFVQELPVPKKKKSGGKKKKGKQ